MSDKGVYLSEVLFEMRRVGRSVRVVAIDPITHTEAILVAPAKLGVDDMTRVGARKLAYVIGKKQAAAEKDNKRIEETREKPLSVPYQRLGPAPSGCGRLADGFEIWY